MRRATFLILVAVALAALLLFGQAFAADESETPEDGWLPGPPAGGGDAVTLDALIAGTAQSRAGIERVRPLLMQAFIARFGDDATLDKARALVSILGNETLPDWNGITPVVGDKTSSGGPSVGPGQVWRSTAKDLGLWTPPAGASADAERAAYQQLASNLGWCLDATCAVFQAKLRAAGGDVSDAVRRYNGSGAAALLYQGKAAIFALTEWGGFNA